MGASLIRTWHDSPAAMPGASSLHYADCVNLSALPGIHAAIARSSPRTSQKWAVGATTSRAYAVAHRSVPLPADEKPRDPEPDSRVLPAGRYGRDDIRAPCR